ncbi:MAG TPA: bifunctional (p)ppGpp synthetase/guanosine-3',5'-bis(diphosphate) 3'-pyrophosphohydrolase [Candidatus Caccopulliclostridium gallistercoris]|uniref:Bifunctional (P)ppGpp synthetase/guanosine-3',5'-bis(Diphosphate) 3'-pyrophosphohydrolase n=1 Tax=Candidatus Caccopulliclostridium gallistercoris TaxID=2840719 RepID=A0A9D1NDK1_9FIRM|nr:bifunctional (p)ppGpp synthetase/guanosine-3',5'-bis(diphosphate) 3'-pyrophosphohydrolase [Candidatus Caccopulliclostridium gallistercoris]
MSIIVYDENLLNSAKDFAIQKHKGQFRKGTKIPYIIHPYEVLKILQENGADIKTQIAGLLHDTLEDTNTTVEEIEANFGSEVAELVKYETEDKRKEYRERKAEHMAKLKTAPLEAKMVNCADKLANLRSTWKECKIGDSFWERFNGSKQDIAWYYGLAIDALQSLSGMPIYENLKDVYKVVFGDMKLNKGNEKL